MHVGLRDKAANPTYVVRLVRLGSLTVLAAATAAATAISISRFDRIDAVAGTPYRRIQFLRRGEVLVELHGRVAAGKRHSHIAHAIDGFERIRYLRGAAFAIYAKYCENFGLHRVFLPLGESGSAFLTRG
jgi:hypothetical protein